MTESKQNFGIVGIFDENETGAEIFFSGRSFFEPVPKNFKLESRSLFEGGDTKACLTISL